MDALEIEFEQAARDVAWAREMVADQRATLEGLRRSGQRISVAESVFGVFVHTLKVLETREQGLRREAERRAEPRSDRVGPDAAMHPAPELLPSPVAILIEREQASA